MDKKQIKSIFEAILFAWSEPISSKDLSKIVDISANEAKAIINEMINEFNFYLRGIQIIEMNEYYQLTTRPEYYEYLQKLFEPKQNKGLTQAALETLSIIAYNQPITKVEIEEIRGVKCDKALSTLLEKDLIKEAGRLEKTGRPILYATTITFLKTFSLKSLDELPDIKELEIHDENDKEIRNIFDR
ncbi:SMC-Scp complex subunit ScpB [Serpentinicella alkaliphila]|uniref:Segregation and condensation protein B n=1 Tax=Serpentinicella alkaliphila TaxID=1734049 RepID=A0A4R2T9V6_9FIRM|nr:SMC-Scp complex subunit ScpB [Serpentinicella alkaliphila]QUH26580.1 SMC-Scp complex subunit ScpB [Serpentinicella alkaliphila]TCP99065.1 segregation and condensation protein B [Serpentinicella alkaliphila]